MFATRRPTFTKQQAPIRRGWISGSRNRHDSRHVRISLAPRSGEVEIAYFTLPKFKGRGFATELARHLIQIVKDMQPGTRVFAFTFPGKNASNRILQKLGFGLAGETRDEEDRVVWRWELAPAGK
jgi:RimJ/RimL family protein N-acetyltransferase